MEARYRAPGESSRFAVLLAWTFGRAPSLVAHTRYYRPVRSLLLVAALTLAGLNVLVFNLTAGRSIGRWDRNKTAPASGKLAAVLSLVLWIGVIFLGRWVGFTKTTVVTPPDLEILDSLDRF